MSIIALFTLALCFISLLRLRLLIYLVTILPAFGSLAVVPPELIGGVSLLAGSFAALLLVLRGLAIRSVRNGMLKSAKRFSELGFLFLFLIIMLLGAFILPRIFEGDIQTFSMQTARLSFVTPTSANLTQSAYLSLSILTTFTIAALMRQPYFFGLLLRAILGGGIAVVVTGLLELLANLAGISTILDIFRTANYAFLTDYEILGAHRVIGLMPEASSYGSMAAGLCGLLLFLRPVYPKRLAQRLLPLTAWGCGVMAMLSTSSTAYVMMAAVLVLYAFYNVRTVESDGTIIRKTVSRRVISVLAALVFVFLIILLDSDLASYLLSLVDTLVFQKQTSSSYLERSSWTANALDAFYASGGLGIGAGSARSSNLFVNILASTGIPGTLLFLLFLYVIFFSKLTGSTSHERVTIQAGRLSLIPMFVGGALAATTPDFGITSGIIFGMIAGTLPRKDRKNVVTL